MMLYELKLMAPDPLIRSAMVRTTVAPAKPSGCPQSPKLWVNVDVVPVRVGDGKYLVLLIAVHRGRQQCQCRKVAGGERDGFIRTRRTQCWRRTARRWRRSELREVPTNAASYE